MHFLNVDYDEENQNTYKSLIFIDQGVGVENVFDSGDPIIDFIDLMKYLDEHDIERYMESSSVNHFLIDGNTYQEGWFDEEGKRVSAKVVLEKGFDKFSKLWVTNNLVTIEDVKKYYYEYKESHE